MSQVCTEILTSAHIDEHMQLGRTVYTTPAVADPGHFAWKHLRNPFGASRCIAMRGDGGTLDGRLMIQPHDFVLANGSTVSGATLTDFVINPLKRSAGALVAIVKAGKQPAGTQVVIHSSNENSDMFYSQLFKFKAEVWLTAVGLPVRAGRLLAGKPGREAAAAAIDLTLSPFRWLLAGLAHAASGLSGLRLGVTPDAARRAQILENFRRCAGPHFERSDAFLRWRCDEPPLYPCRLEGVWVGDKCIGLIAWQQMVKGRVQVLAIVESILERPLRAGEAVALKLALLHRCASAGMDAIFTLANTQHPLLRWLSGFPFVHLPASRLPHASPLYFHAAKEIFPLADRPQVFYNLADLDYF